MENYPSQKKEQPKSSLEYLKYTGVAAQMIGTLCVAAFGGLWLDEHFKVKSKLFTVFLLIFALIISMYALIKGLTSNEQKQD